MLGSSLLVLGVAAATSEGSPSQVIDTLHTTLLDVMKEADTLGYSGRFERLTPIVRDTFDTRFMTQKSVGRRRWQALSEDEKREVYETFVRFTIANYAGRFDGYSGEEFRRLGEEDSLHGTRLVKTELIVPEDDDVQLHYLVRPVDAGWKVIDVYLDGTVSELALRRSQYAALIDRGGASALIDALEEKIAELEAGES